MPKSRSRVYAHVKQDRFIIENAESTTGWVAGTDVTALTTTTTHREGTNAITFAKSAATVAAGTISKTLSGGNILNLVEYYDGKLRYWIYLSSLTDVTSISLTLGESASHNYVYTTLVAALSAGWNYVELDVDSPTTTTGTGAAWSSINYIALTVTLSAADKTLTGIIFDTLAAIYEFDVNIENVNLSGTGLATSALQTSGNAILTTIDADTGTISTNSGTIAGDTTSIDGKIPSLGTAAMAASSPITVATDDTQFGAIGAASDVDGNIHGQLRFIGEAVDGLETDIATIAGDTTSIDGKITACNTGAIAGTVTANAGTNLNTSLLALETGGNLAAIATSASVLDDWDESDRAKVNLIVGQAGILGGTTTVATPAANIANSLPWAVYNATPTVRLEGQGGPLQTNSSGDLHSNLNTLLAGEDQTNGGLAQFRKPVSVSNYSATFSDISTALEASSVSRNTSANLVALWGRLDSTAPSATYYIQVLNASSLPADGAVTHLINPLKIVHVNGVDDYFSYSDIIPQEYPIYASTGVVVCISTTEFNKTISSAYLSMTVLCN